MCQIWEVIVGCRFTIKTAETAMIVRVTKRALSQARKVSRSTMRDYKEIAGVIADDFGANATYVEDLLRQFQHNPNSVDEDWSEYFQSLLGAAESIGSVKVESRTANGATTAPVPAAQPASPAPLATTAASIAPGTPQPAPAAAETAAGERIQIRGPALKIVQNMESSLAVPIATSARQIQIKLLDEN